MTPEEIDRIVAGLTDTELVALLSGSTLFETTGNPVAGIPRVRMLDGPAGVRGMEFLDTSSLCVLCHSALGATWDTELVEEVGQVLGRQLRAKGARLHLAPTLNLQRTPVGGRNFESFGEDPVLVSSLGVAYIEGVQSEGAGSCVKHFVGNDTEHERFTINSVIDERTLREVYLRPFEAAVRVANVPAVMASYNSVNGPTMSEHRALLTDVLRRQWGFDGLVISDWYGVRSTVDALVAGTDLEMPGPGSQRGQLLADAIERGEIDRSVVEGAARRILGAFERVGAFEEEAPAAETTFDDPADRDVVRRAAAQSMVLLRNRADASGEMVLPMRADRLRRVAIIGPNAAQGQIGGGGSAMVRATHVSTPLATMRTRLAECEVVHAEGCSINRGLPPFNFDLFDEFVVELFDDPYAADDPASTATRASLVNTSRMLWFHDPFRPDEAPSFSARVTTSFTPDRTGPWTFGLRSIGDATFSVDGAVLLDNDDAELAAITALGKPEQTIDIDLEAGVTYTLSARLRRISDGDGLSGLILGCERPAAEDPIGEAVRLAAESDLTVLVVGTNGDWETEGRDRDDIVLPGDQDELVRRVAATSTKTVVVVNAGSVVAMPWIDEVDAVLMAWFPGELFGEALLEVLLGEAEPQGRLPVTFPRQLSDSPTAAHHPGTDGVAMYGEGRLIGHRWYDTRGVEPQFPFGFGLGYARIEISDAATTGPLTVSVRLRNDGHRDGVEVVQIYAHAIDRGSVDTEPEQWLVGFAKVRVAARSAADATIRLDARALQTWDVATRSWEPYACPIELRVGTSSRHCSARLMLQPTAEAV